MNPSGHPGRSRGHGRVPPVHGNNTQVKHPTSAPGQRGSFDKAEGRGYRQRSLSQRTAQHCSRDAHAREQDAIGKAYSCLRTRPQQALDAAQALLDRYSTHPVPCVPVLHLKARALFQLKKFDDCIAFINALETRARNDKGLLLTKARALQAKGCFNQALPFFQHLYAHHKLAYKDHKVHGLALGRQLQLLGGTTNLEKVLAIFTQLRTRTTGGRARTPCNDKEIELALGRHLQLMGGPANLHKAWVIYTQLRTRAAGERTNTPCNDKEIELALGRCLQIMGGEDNMEQALAIFTRLRTLRAGGRINTPCNDKEIELTLGRHLQRMGGPDNLQQALAIFTRLRAWCAGGRTNTPCDDKDIELTLGRHLQLMGGADNLEKALVIFTRLHTGRVAGRDTPGHDKDIELTLGRHVQLMGGTDNLERALAIYTRLRRHAAGGLANTPCNDKDIELTLGRHLQLMGGADNLERALAIYTRLRRHAAGGLANTPCNDKDIELTLGRHLQLMGGADNLKQTLAIYTRLRRRAAGGRKNTPCNDKEIELALGRHYERLGGAANLERALAIVTRLRTHAAAGKVNTPCNDKDIELSLGRLLQRKGGQHNLEQALAIYTQLRRRAAGGKADAACNDKEIELALASLLTDMQMWPQFDELRIEARFFPGFEPHLCLSVRNFTEMLEAPNISPGHSRLLGQAIKSAVLAIEASGLMNDSCLSQLAHCVRLLSCWPDVLLQQRGIHQKDARGLSAAAHFLFDTAYKIAPYRQRLEKDQHWRAREQELLTILSQQNRTHSLHQPWTHSAVLPLLPAARTSLPLPFS